MRRLLAATVFLLVMGGDPPRFAHASPVLLTFDVEDDQDIPALHALGLTEPATYFVTGEWAGRHPDAVAALARANTVGLHGYSHQDLTDLTTPDLRKELLLGHLVLEKAMGRTALWFRAPYLKYDARVITILSELGFRYDSSQGRSQEPIDLLELPISFAGDLLASDYDIFHKAGLSETAALQWLRQLYREKAAHGRPLVIGLHPRIIARQGGVLRSFISEVRAEGGVFLTADAYVEQVRRASPARLGAWVGLDREPVDPEQLARDALAAGLTDVFLMAKSTSGVRYFGSGRDEGRDVFGEAARALRRAGVRVHAWLPVGLDRRMARGRPEWAMVAQNGSRSADWVSLSHPEVRRWLGDAVVELLTGYDLDGIHLDDLRYPGLDYDFSPHALEAFRRATGSAGATRATLLSGAHYVPWTSWRAQQIAELTGELRGVIARAGYARVSLSAAVQARPALSRRAMEEGGQDYERLAERLDFMVVMAYFKEHGESIPWISRVAFAARTKAGAGHPLFMGIEAYQHPERWRYTTRELAETLAAARAGADGLVLFQYLYLFGRGAADWNMPAGSVDLLRRVPADGRRASLPVLLGAAVALASLFAAGVYRFGREPRPEAAGPTPNEPGTAALDWRDAEAQIETGSVAGPLAAQVSAFLRRLGSQQVDRLRHAAMLDAVGGSPELERALDVVAGWRILGGRYLRDALARGHVRAVDGTLELTPSGRRELLSAREAGYDPAFWRFVEKRLHETLLVACPACRATNHGHWFWASLECYRCHHRVSLDGCGVLSLRPSAVALHSCEVAAPEGGDERHGRLKIS